jgi:hypothetical protein
MRRDISGGAKGKGGKWGGTGKENESEHRGKEWVAGERKRVGRGSYGRRRYCEYLAVEEEAERNRAEIQIEKQ